MKSVGGLDTSMYKELSTKKTSKDRSAIRRKLERIKRKLRAGGRLSPAEKEFLRKYAPGLYREAIAAEQEREAYEARLRQCRTKEEAERVKTEKMMEMMAKKDEAAEIKMIRMAQTKAAEEAAQSSLRRLPSLVDLENRRREAPGTPILSVSPPGTVRALPRVRESVRKKKASKSTREPRTFPHRS